jgi:type I restriction enzyme S subunit
MTNRARQNPITSDHAGVPLPSERHQLPDGWVWTKVEDAGAVQLGRQRAPQYHNGPNMRPYLRVANVYEARIDISDVLEMNFDPRDFERYRLKPGDVLLNEGQSKELVGRAAIYRGEVPGACFQNTLVRFTSRSDILPEWALAVFRTYLYDGTFRSIAQWTTNMAHLGAARFSQLDFPVAPEAEQVRIVDALDSYLTRLDAAAEGLKRVEANLKRYRASVLKAAVEGHLVPTEAELAKKEKRTCEPASVLLERILKERRHRWEQAELAKMKAKGEVPKNDAWKKTYEAPASLDASSLPELPDGWCWTTVEQVGRVQLGRQRAPQHHQGLNMRPYLRVANVYEDRLNLSDVMEMNFSPTDFETYRLRPGDILLNEGQSLELVGRPAMYRGEVPGACFQNTLVRFRAIEPMNDRYALITFRAYLHNGRFQKIASWTTNIAHLGAGRFATLEFPLPPLAEQERVVEEVERLLTMADAVASSTRKRRAQLARLRQAILRWAFEGKLVDQDPNDEPASVLLERIRRERESSQQAKSPKPERARRKSA